MKLTKKAKASLLILLTGGTMTTMSATIEDQSAFEKAINNVKIEYEYEGIYELSQSYSDWKDYKGVDYNYKIAKIYDVFKTGNVAIYRDKDKKAVTLITCLGNDKQLVVIGYLKDTVTL